MNIERTFVRAALCGLLLGSIAPVVQAQATGVSSTPAAAQATQPAPSVLPPKASTVVATNWQWQTDLHVLDLGNFLGFNLVWVWVETFTTPAWHQYSRGAQAGDPVAGRIDIFDSALAAGLGLPPAMTFHLAPYVGSGPTANIRLAGVAIFPSRGHGHSFHIRVDHSVPGMTLFNTRVEFYDVQ